ncbi:probable cytochrome P450 6a23 [Drosophila eugracilis]|uniref:probable cytochrome P450 6a23 n=1 Tax=Drosophila eugracilis TaxID=29029 RepID=UPI0007E73DDA|nr:probable cytochrome P450 6a23 [Drosophila eugracilis]
MSLLLTLVALLVSLLLFVARRRHGYWQRRGIPHDVPHPLYGNIKDWPKKRHIAKIFGDYYLKYKGSGYPFAGFFFFFTRNAVITDLELVKRVLIKDFNNFENRGIFYNEIDDPLSATLFSIEGQKWRHLRHKLTPTFTSGKMKNMFPIVVKIAEDLEKTFSGKITSGQGQVLEVVDLVARYTSDVIGNCAFGLNCNSLHNPKADFVTIGKRAIVERRYGGLLDFFIFGFPKLSRRLHLKITVKDVEDFYTQIVRETVEYRLKTKEKRNDFMDSLIEMYQKEQAGNTEDGLSFNEILAQAFIFFLAGFETSSTTMGFALYELAQNQDVQDKLRDEVNHVLAKHNNEFTYEAIKEMKYLEQVVMETLRKYPVLAHLTRMTQTDFAPEDPKNFIGKGTIVIIPALGIHYDPDIYPEPEKFKPERFTEEEIAARPSCTWLPFGEGPRNCIGLRFGLMQTCVGLAYLIRGYKFSVAPETEIPLKIAVKNILISAENGIHLKVDKLSK